MALVLADRVKETTTTTGTATYTLAGASTGFESFASIGDGNTTYYACTDGTDFEVGIGTYTASGTTLARTTILQSSNSDAAVSWSSGTKTIFCCQPAEKAVFLDASGNIAAFNGSNLTNVDASQLDSQAPAYYLNYNNFTNTPTIPTNNNELTNGAGYITSADGGNAQTLDSLDSTQFLRSDAADTKTSGDLTFSDNVKAVFGTDSDLEIFHDGSNSLIRDEGSGSLYFTVNGSTIFLRNATDGEDLAKFISNGSVELYHDNSKKLETTSTGATVTGTLTIEHTVPVLRLFDTNNGTDEKNLNISLTSDGDLRFQALNDALGGGGDFAEFRRTGNNITGFALLDNAVDKTFFSTQNGVDNFINNGGNLGIGTDSPSTALEVVGDLTLTSTDDGDATDPSLVLFRDSASPTAGDSIGSLGFHGNSSTDTERQYAFTRGSIVGATDGNEYGQLRMGVIKAGSTLTAININAAQNETRFQNLPVELDDVDLTIVSTDAGSASDPQFIFFRDSPSPADNDALGKFVFKGKNDAAQQVQYGSILSRIVDATDGTEVGSFEFQTISGGSVATNLRLDASTAVGVRLLNGGETNIRFDTGTAFDNNHIDLTPASATGSRTITLPDATGTLPVFTTAPTGAIADGTNGQVLTTNGSGTLSFTTVSGGGSTPVYFDAYKSSATQSFTTATITVDFNTARQNSDATIFSNSSGEITVSDTGVYKIEYSVVVGVSSGTTRSEAVIFLERRPSGGSFAEVAGTASFTYNRQELIDSTTASISILQSVTSGDTYRVRVNRNDGASTLVVKANQARFNFLKID